MRLTAELIASSEQRTNTLGEREIILRGLAIPVIEHLGVTRDAFDAIDLTDNRLGRLENFPRLLRLSSLSLSGNLIETIDSNNLSKNLPNLKHLDISYNQISTLLEVSNLGKAYKVDSDNAKMGALEVLNLHGNPVQRRQHYRLYTIQSIPSLKILDHQRISQKERDRAKRLASSAAGAALESDIQDEAGRQKTFIPGEGASAEESFVVNFTAEEKDQIRQMVANAESPEEIEEIERCVQRGVFPKHALKKVAVGGQNDGNQSNERKRPLLSSTEEGNDDEDANGSREKKLKSEQ